MPDIVVERETYILVSNSSVGLYPSPNVFPDPELYPGGADRVSNIVEGSMELDELLCDGDLQFGQMCANRFEVTVYDTEDISGKYIAVYQEDNGIFHELFTGIVDSAKLDRLGTERQVIAYDLGYRRSRVNVADWYTNFWNTHSSATLKQFRDDLLYHMGISYEDVVLINDNITLTKTVNITSIAFNEMLRMICELSCCFPHYNRDGELEFVMLNSEGTPTSLEGLYEGENSTFEDYNVQAFTGIQFYGNTSDLQYTEGSSANPYSIQENILLYNRTNAELHTIGAAMLDYISDITYKPSSVKMIISDWNYNLGDILSTEKGSFYVLHQTFNGSQLIEQLIEQRGSELQDQVGTETSISDLIKDTEMNEVDAQIGDINEDIGDINEEIEDINENVGNLEIHLNRTDDGLAAEVTNRTNADTTLQSSITQTATSINLEVAKKAAKTEIVSLINISKDTITMNSGHIQLSSGKLTITSGNFQLDSSGNATATNFISKNHVKFVDSNGNYPVFLSPVYKRNSYQGLGFFSNTSHSSYSDIICGNVWGDIISGTHVDGNRVTQDNENVATENWVNSQGFLKNHQDLSSYLKSVTSGSSSQGTWTTWNNHIVVNDVYKEGQSVCARRYNVNVSDVRLKEWIMDMPDFTNAYMKFRPKEFNFHHDLPYQDHGRHYGLIAQDFKRICDEEGIDLNDNLHSIWHTRDVEVEGNECRYIGDGKVQVFVTEDLHAIHIQMIQKQQREIEELKARISVLEEEVSNGISKSESDE